MSYYCTCIHFALYKTCFALYNLHIVTLLRMICPICGSRLATVSAFKTHLHLIHSNEVSFQITCGIQECQRTFVNFPTYHNHVYSVHSCRVINEDNSCGDFDTKLVLESSDVSTSRTLAFEDDQIISAELSVDDQLETNTTGMKYTACK